jgi:hypothetical protein
MQNDRKCKYLITTFPPGNVIEHRYYSILSILFKRKNLKFRALLRKTLCKPLTQKALLLYDDIRRSLN